METGRTYTLNKGINKPIEFRGLKAQYIWHLAGSMVGAMVVFALLYIAGMSAYVDVALALGLGGLLVSRVYRMSRKYGQYGLMKKSARKAVPRALLSRSRKCFIQIYSDDSGNIG